MTGALFRPESTPEAMRRRFDRLATVSREQLQKRHPQLRFADHDCDGVYAESVLAVAEPRRVIVYLHGGAFVFGSVAGHRSRAVRLSYRCQAEVLMVDYRLAPEHPYPAALEDACRAAGYAARRYPDLPLVLGGDSAGGGLALATLAVLRAARRPDSGPVPPFKVPSPIPQPKSAILFSPWTDLAMTGRSIRENERRDVWLSRRHLESWGACYRGTASKTNPFVSPLYADVAGFPPLMFVVGDREVLLADSLRIAERARQADVAVRVEVGRRMQHDFPLALPWLKESRRAWQTIDEFLARHAAPSSPSSPSSPS